MLNSYTSEEEVVPTVEANHECPAHHDILDNVYSTLIDVQFYISGDNRKEHAATAVSLCEKYSLGELYHRQRVLVWWPDLLARYLMICTKLSKDDFECMLTRCVEHDLLESAKILINYADGCPTLHEAELVLLPDKYKISESVYKLCKIAGYKDPYYDNPHRAYTRPKMLDKYNSGQYAGYRYAYHLLMYGDERVVELIEWWNRRGIDCTFEAACAYFRKDDNILLSEMKKLVLDHSL